MQKVKFSWILRTLRVSEQRMIIVFNRTATGTSVLVINHFNLFVFCDLKFVIFSLRPELLRYAPA